MSYDLVFNQFKQIKDFDERVRFLATVDFKKEVQPWCFLQFFDDLKDRQDPFTDADLIAKAFSYSGLILVEGEASYCCGKLMTIMNEFESEERANDDVANWLLHRAFKKAGFKYASECDDATLIRLYHMQGYFGFRQ